MFYVHIASDKSLMINNHYTVLNWLCLVLCSPLNSHLVPHIRTCMNFMQIGGRPLNDNYIRNKLSLRDTPDT